MEQQRVILVGLATGSVVARGALWTCVRGRAWWIALYLLEMASLRP